MTDDFETIEKFKKNNSVGWLTAYQIYHVGQYEHFSFFEDNPLMFPKITRMIEDFKEREIQASQDWVRDLAPNAHPSWHVFECHWANEKIDLHSELLEILYKSGWARIGTYKADGINCFEVETTQMTKYRVMGKAMEIAEMLDREIVWNIV